MARTALGTKESLQGSQFAAKDLSTSRYSMGAVSDGSEDSIGPQNPRTPDEETEIKHSLPRVSKPQSQIKKTPKPRDIPAEEETEEKPLKVVPLFGRALAPTCTSAPACDHVELAWEPIGVNGFREPLPPGLEEPVIDIGYKVAMQEVDRQDHTSLPGVGWKVVYDGVGTSAQIKLRPGRCYAFRLTCLPLGFDPIVVIEDQDPSEPAFFETLPSRPSAPQPPSLSNKDKRELTLRWTQPAENGGRRIEEYTLQVRPCPGSLTNAEPSEDGFYHFYSGHEVRVRIPRLQPACLYEARIKARNCVGESGWSDVGQYHTDAAVPSQPDKPEVVSLAPTSADLRWAPPPDNNSPIEQYVLERATAENGQATSVYTLQYSGPETQVQCQGLQSGTSYLFRLAAYNQVGKSPNSHLLELRTLATGPGAPRVPRAVGQNRTSITVEWQGPDDDGGSPVINYEVELRPKGRAALEGMTDEWLVMYQGKATAHTLENLKAGCVYRVRVRAQNSAGFGPYSIVADVETAPDVPDAPEQPRTTSRSASGLAIEWAAPDHDGGAQITSYRVEVARLGPSEGTPADGELPSADGASFFTWPAADAGLERRAQLEGPAPHFPEGLQPGTWYAFRVYAVNGEGASHASQVGVACTRPAAPLSPGAPHLTAAPTASGLQLTWDEPVRRGAPISSYIVEMCRASDLLPRPAAPRSEASSNAAHSRSGGEEEEEDNRAGANGHAEAGHQPPAQVPVAFTVVHTGSGRACAVKGLEPFTEYVFRVRATSSAGGSEWGPLSSFTTGPASPTAPQNLQAQGTSSSSIELTWEEPLRDNGSAVMGYSLEMASGGVRGKAVKVQSHKVQWHKVYNGASPSATVGDLRPGREYQFRVRAVNARGQSPWTDTVRADTRPGPPGAPAPPTCTKRTATWVQLKWDPPLEDNGAPVLRYRLEVAPEGETFSSAYTGNQTTTKVENLDPATTYSFRVMACNYKGEGPFSEIAQTSTSLLPPFPPSQVSVETRNDLKKRTVIAVSWVATKGEWPHAEATSSEIVVTDATGGQPLKATCGRATECELGEASPGHEYQVRVRSAGAKGAGHSTWSEAVSIRIPDAQAKSQAMVLTPAGTALACEVQSGPITTSRSKKKPGMDVDAHLKTLLEKKAAPPPSKKATKRTRKEWRDKYFLPILVAGVLVALFVWILYEVFGPKIVRKP